MDEVKHLRISIVSARLQANPYPCFYTEWFTCFMKLLNMLPIAVIIFVVGFCAETPVTNAVERFNPEGSHTAVYKQGRAYLDSFGGKDVILEVVKPREKCSATKEAVACAVISENHIYINDNILSTNVQLKSVVAHEYVHTLTSQKEAEWITKHVHVKGILSAEVIADCGIPYFVDPNSPDYSASYMGHGCTPYEIKVAGEVINNQPLG